MAILAGVKRFRAAVKSVADTSDVVFAVANACDAIPAAFKFGIRFVNDEVIPCIDVPKEEALIAFHAEDSAAVAVTTDTIVIGSPPRAAPKLKI